MSKKIFTIYPYLLLLPMMLFGIIGLQEVKAQSCTVACHTNLNFPLPESGSGCSVQITPELLVNTGSGTCAIDQIQVRLMFQDGTEIPNSPTVDETYIGQTLKYEVTYLPNPDQGNCWGNLTIMDEKAPSFTNCDNDISINCFQNALPVSEGGDVPDPLVTDCSSFTVAFADEMVENDCAGTTTDVITRTWTATDEFGNANTCVQNITVDRVSLAAGGNLPVCPADTSVDCTVDMDFSPMTTGYPTVDVNGESFELIPNNTSFCDIMVSFRDEIFPLCGGGYKTVRTWLIWDVCQPEVDGINPWRCEQDIKVEDLGGPNIVVQDTLILNMSNSQCEATFPLPIADVTDACSPIQEVIIRTEFDEYEGNTGVFATLPAGEHIVTYEATDECNNLSTFEMLAIVQDNTPPIAVCLENTAVGLTIDGGAIIFASSFDRGSFDNCAVDTFLVRRMASDCLPASDFDSFVSFNCCEVGEVVMVQFRVFDISGNFNDCMVEVEVQDKLAPQLTCPPDKTVDCMHDLDDLTGLGQVGVLDNCDYEVEEELISNINSCGTGSVQRIFTVTDAGGQVSTCTQMIYVEDNLPFTDEFIDWPADYFTNVCDQDIAPESLPIVPENYGYPIFRGGACENVAATFEDRILEGDFPACYKILRRWTVIDWCQYNPNSNTNNGRWMHEQVIKVDDQQLPVVDCVADIMVDNNTNNCASMFVEIPPITVTDCSRDLSFSYRVDFDNDGEDLRYFVGADASDTYPQGTHRIIFQVGDGCGNLGTCETLITIRDTKAPTAICNNGVSVDLMEMSGGTGMVDIDPMMVDASSSDNCTNREDLIFTLTPSRFTCADIGTNEVTLTVTDAMGNSSRCTTFILIQDNDNGCPGGVMAALGGHVESENGDMVEEVKIDINGSQSATQMTNGAGEFMFPNLPIGGDFTLSPQKTDDIANGVTTFDLVLMTKHILGIRTFDSPYKMLAADINRSSSITTLDVVQMRKVILNLVDEFPNNDSWRFVDAAYQFPDATNPWLETIPEIRSYNDVDRSNMNVDFIAIKIGDVNGSAIMNSIQTVDERTEAGEWTLWTDDQQVSKNELVTVQFQTEDWATLQGYQFTLDFDANELEFVNFDADELSILTKNNFNFAQANEGMITTSWHQVNTDAATTDKTVQQLFNLTFRAKTDGQLSDLLHLNSTAVEAQAYQSNGDGISLLPVRLRFRAVDTSEEVVLYQNRPNPFSGSTEINFYLPHAETVTLSVFDVSGKLLWSTQQEYSAGLQRIQLSKTDVQQSGVLYYRLATRRFTATKKMIKM
ncbi:MAG: T9SS type A sorting domain-containing protein [Saprospiraceae bacterium]